MTTDSQVDKNLALTFSFLRRQERENPTVLDEIPNRATIVFLQDDDPEQTEANLQLAMRSARAGKNVYLHHLKSMAAT